MLRSTLLWASTHRVLAERLPRQAFVRRAVRRFMPGEAPGDALREGTALRERGVPTLVTCLGENVTSREQAAQVGTHYLELADLIAAAGLDMELSVKLTHLGLDLDPGLAVAQTVAAAARSHGVVWIDMEDSSYVDVTLAAYRDARAATDRVGICLQAYLRRTPDDLAALIASGLRPHVRLVKGAYREPAEVAFPRKADVDAAYLHLALQMLEARRDGRMGRVGIGTHDPALIDRLVTAAREMGLGPDDFEVEMLYGIGAPTQDRLVAGGAPLRVLISYGAHWFPWYMRRLAERPANVGFVLRQLFA